MIPGIGIPDWLDLLWGVLGAVVGWLSRHFGFPIGGGNGK